MTNDPQSVDRRIAIIGMGCRFPGGADTPERFWQLLRDGVDATGEIPEGRWDREQLFDPEPGRPGKLYTTRGGFLGDVAGFDAHFFGMSPREAMHVDPQQRLLLEMTYEAFEDAGLTLTALAGSSTSVFVGVATHDYADMHMYPGNRALIDARSNVGVASSLAANRISYVYDLQGPSMIVDTACSSALTAAHLAIASLRRGECSLALVGGIQLMLTPEPTIGFCKATMLSPDGRCAAFDASANGYARSEGGAVIVLKPLAAALADGDRVYAVIEGSAINQDGHTTGMTVPSTDAQAAMLRAALADAGVTASDIDYVEAHGTGTPVGDPLEAAAIGAVFGPAKGPGASLPIGSVKTNLGHLEAAAGMAGLCKTALSLYHREVPPSLHFHTPNPAIDFDQLRLRVVTELEPWPTGPTDRPGLAGVNSFGFGGANAHVVVRGFTQPAPVPAGPPSPPRPQVLVVSARGADALTGNLTSFAQAVSAIPADATDEVSAFCRTAAVRRTQHDHRAAVVAETPADLAELLAALAVGDRRAAGATGRSRAADARVAFVFAGMGPQWWGMGRSLLDHDRDFAAVIARCEAALAGLTPWSLTDQLRRNEADSEIARTEVAQVTNFALQVGLAAVLARLGIEPDAVIGHSAGEMAAACVAGALSIESGAALAWHRGRLQAGTAGLGRMLAVGLPVVAARELLADFQARGSGGVSIAAINDPSSVTLSGDEDTLTAIAETLTERQQFGRFLSVEVPYHSAHMDGIEDELRAALTFLDPGSAKIAMVSTVNGDWVDGGDLDVDYWWRNVRQPVRFADGIDQLLDDGFTTFLEISPHPVLGQSVAAALAARDRVGATVGTLRRGEDDKTSVLRAAATLWTRGVTVDWTSAHGAGPDRAELPLYVWDRSRHWFESAPQSAAPGPIESNPWVHPLLGWRLPAAVPHWQAELVEPGLRWLDDHVLRGTVVYPGAAYVESMLAAARALGAEQPAARGISLSRALVLAPRDAVAVQCAISETGVSIHAGAGDRWEEHANGRFDEAGRAPTSIDLAAVRERCPQLLPHESVYSAFARRGLRYGPAFTGITEATVGDGVALAQLVLPASAGSAAGYLVHPALLDAAFQLLILAAGGDDDDDALFVPVRIDRVAAYQPVGASCGAVARIVSATEAAVVGEVDLVDESGTVLVTVRGIQCRPLDERAAPTETVADWLYELRWEAPEDGDGGPSVLERSIDDAIAPVQAEVDAVARDQDWSIYYTDAEPALQAAAAGFTWSLLQQSGWDPVQPATSAQLLARLAPAANRGRQAEALLAGLVDGGWLREAGGLLVGNDVPPADPDQILDGLATSQPRFATDVALVRRAGAALASVLRGDVGGAEALLGDEGTELLRHFYRDAPASMFTNTLISRAAEALVADRADVRPLRVLEVGGGTGGTTEHLRRALPPDTQYVFTDISPMFTQAMALATPAVSSRVFDIERPLDDQDMTGGFDLVVAANVMHATADLTASMARIRELLAPGGRLLLVEITRPLLWLDVVFGASPGWWAYADDYRPSGALLEPEAWIRVLGDAGFVDTRVVADRPETGPPGQCVLVAGRPVIDGPSVALEPAGLWAVSGAGSLADSIRGQLAELDAFAGDDAIPTGLIHVGTGELTGFIDIARMRTATLPDGVWAITCGAQAVGPSGPDPEAAALWGLVRVARKEYPDQPWRLVDLPAEPTADDVGQLLRLLFQSGSVDGEEDEIALRAGRRLVRRLRRISMHGAPRPAHPEEGWRADVQRAGALDTLLPRPAARRVPGPGEVEIRIDAASCNFRDVMLASGLLPAMASEGTFADRLLGLDLAGTIVACGPGVGDLSPGDAVFGIGPGTFASYTTTPAELVTRIPPGLGRESAAASPCAFVTAVYALERIAALRPGERVLIHAATGGVGLAAVQVARALGAEVLATAGSDEKRALLRELGVEHVFDSRSLDFADGVLGATGGEGVDVVLNSLAGPAIAAGLRCLAKYGRFVEIGKRDIYADATLELLPFRRNLSFSAVDLDLLCRERPALAGSLLRLVAERLADGVYQALPMTIFPVQQTSSALRLLGQARHIGKVVIKVSGTDVQLDAPAPGPLARPDGAYLVTGGTGGFGRQVSSWLADQGAGSIVLMSRTGCDEATLDALRQRCAPASVSVALGDVADDADVRRVLEQIRRDGPPLRGIVHAAMTLSDMPLADLTEDELRTGMRAKLDGAHVLDALTAADDLDFFVAFSSIASLLGNPLQAAYAAANAAMAALIQRRRAAGRPGTVIDWGVLGEVGYVADNPDIAAFLSRQGYLPFQPTQALAALTAALTDGRPQLMAARIDWSRWALTATREASTPRLAHFAPTATATGTPASAALVGWSELSPEQRREAVRERVRTIVATLLGISPARVDPDRTLFDLGFDSLIAVELTVRLQADFGVELAVLQLLKDMTIDSLADVVLRDAAALPESSVEPPVSAIPVPEAASPPRATLPRVESTTATPPPPSAAVVRYSALDYHRWTRGQRLIQRTVAASSRPLLDVDVQGAEHLQTPGAYILATNHLTLLDVPLVLAVMPRPAVIFAAPELRRYPWINWLLSDLGNAIYVDRGAGDVEAIEQGLAVLRSGGVLGLSPEGVRRPQLTRAKTGAARLAAGASAPVVPLAIWGQDELAQHWRRGRRAHVHIRVGAPIPPPDATTTASPSAILIAHTNKIMANIAALLPDRYRGEYAEAATELSR